MDHNKEIINNSDTDSARIHLRSRKEKKQEEDAQNVVTNKRRKGSSKTPANKRPNTSTNKRAKTSSEALYTFIVNYAKANHKMTNGLVKCLKGLVEEYEKKFDDQKKRSDDLAEMVKALQDSVKKLQAEKNGKTPQPVPHPTERPTSSYGTAS